jgi:uncharacterized protein (DUF58 family)
MRRRFGEARIALSEAWAWMAGLQLFLGYVFQLPGLLALSALMFAMMGTSWLWNHFSLHGLRYRRQLYYHRGFPGEKIECELSVANDKLLPLAWLKIRDRWPTAVAPLDPLSLAPSHLPDEGFMNLILVMRPFSLIRRRYELLLRRRGVYLIGKADALAGDPFSLFTSQRIFPEIERVVVFPEVRPAADILPRPEDPYGEQRSPRRLFEDHSRPMGVRTYHPQDGFRRIHWPATARTGRLQTRVYQPVSGLDFIVCLNAATFERPWEGHLPLLQEELIRVAASLIHQAFQQGYRVGLVSNGCIAHSGQPFRIPPSRAKGHLAHLLEALAGLTPVVSAPFERYLMEQASRLDYGSVFLIVSAVTPSTMVEVILRLRRRSRKVLLISLAEEPPPQIPGVQVVYRPYDLNEAAA